MELRIRGLLWFGFIIATIAFLARLLQNVVSLWLENIARLVRQAFAVQRCGAFGVIVFFYFIEIVFEFIFLPLTVFAGKRSLHGAIWAQEIFLARDFAHVL